MKNLNKLLVFMKPYWANAVMNVLFNVLSTIFALFTVTMAIPFLNILFGNEQLVTTAGHFTLSTSGVKHYFYYILSWFIIGYGKAAALGMVCALVIVMTFLKTWFRYIGMYNLAPLRNGIVKDLRNQLFVKVLDLPLSYFTDEKKGDIMSRMSNDVKEIEWSILSSLEMLFRDPLTILIFLITLVILSPGLSLFVFLLLPISVFIIGKLGKNLKKQSKSGQEKVGELLQMIDETVGGMRVVKAFTAEDMVLGRFSKLNQGYTSLQNKIYRRTYLSNPLSEFLGTTVVIVAMWYGAFMVMNHLGSLSAETLIAYLLIFAQIINPAKSFSQARYNVRKGLASADRIYEVLNTINPIQEKPDAKPIKTFESKIEYRGVSFRYNTEEVLKNIDLTIRKGQTIALVGPSGAGKSTMVDLLPRFYDTTEGDILIDGVSIRDYKIGDLRCLMGIVNQEPILFNDTIFNNIGFGASEFSLEEVEAAARIANAREFILNTDEGYQTVIGDRGQKLSGGQRQRLSIARAVLKNPPILILDEATSSLDTESERLVQDALANVMQNRTSIIIAHRLSTIRNADLICVLSEGQIVEMGKHDELLKNNGLYKKLHSMQMFD
ncbi:MAG TPA: ABC transporter ATP-binding protein [Bacteroidales bacterium]|nr:ABC transporter ATP-binding protein [Bacteroidales bacterium]